MMTPYDIIIKPVISERSMDDGAEIGRASCRERV